MDQNLRTGNKMLWKRGEIAPKEQFLLFSQYFQYISKFRSQITYSFVKCGCNCSNFFNSANLTCRGLDISKYFREFLGLRDNESRLYLGIFREIVLYYHGNVCFVDSTLMSLSTYFYYIEYQNKIPKLSTSAS